MKAAGEAMKKEKSPEPEKEKPKNHDETVRLPVRLPGNRKKNLKNLQKLIGILHRKKF